MKKLFVFAGVLLLAFSPVAAQNADSVRFRRVDGKPVTIETVDRDFCFLLNAYDIEPGSYVPKVNTMLDFNLWTWNSRAFPGIDSLNVAAAAAVAFWQLR